MTEVIESDIAFPDLPPTKFIAVVNGVAAFTNFAVGSAEPVKPQHTDFIARNLVPFLIKQIEALQFADQVATIHLFGEASATGSAQRNQALSTARATNIGTAIEHEFDRQKTSGRFSQGVHIVVDPKGLGDRAGRIALEALEKSSGSHFSSGQVEQFESKFRCAFVSLKARHVVVDGDKIVMCRQLFGLTFKTEKVPANLLEQTFDDLMAKAGPFLSGALAAAFKVFVGESKSQLKNVLKELEVGAPELFIIFESVDFIIPSETILAFQFKNPRGRTAIYKFVGSENKKNLTLLDLLSRLISMTRWLKLLTEKLALFPNLNNLRKLVQGMLTKATKNVNDLLGPRSFGRSVIGDGAADILLGLLTGGTPDATMFVGSAFFRVEFAKPGVFDIGTFNGPARTETREFLGSANVELEFLAQGPEGRLGFNARVKIENNFSLTSGLIGFGIAKGGLTVNTQFPSP